MSPPGPGARKSSASIGDSNCKTNVKDAKRANKKIQNQNNHLHCFPCFEKSVPVYKLPPTALMAIFGTEPTAQYHAGPTPWVIYQGLKYNLPPDLLREKMRLKIMGAATRPT